MSLSTANTTNQQYSANLFTDISAPGAQNPNVVPNNITSNIAAANASKMMGGGIPFLIQGGTKRRRTINRKKIKKISSKYKMRGSRKQIRRIKSRLLRRSRRTRSNRGTRTRRRRSNKRMRGGQSQYMSNVAANASYSTGGILSASDSARANPVPFASNDVNSFDAYNHYR
jgi:hypothetical protein